MRPLKPSGFNSFTFFELLFLMLIVAVFTGILLPGMKNLRTQSNRANCEYNLLTLGMALQTYASDHDLYPSTGKLVTRLKDAKYISSVHDFVCPLDTSGTGDTYSVGYIGGHPRTIRYNDPLIVCGWHPRIGTLAVFSDTMVMPLHKRGNTGDVTATPLTITHDGGAVDPEFVLHDTEPLLIETDTGESALVYGTNGSYFISASYDPLAYDGIGEFVLFIGYDLEGGTPETVSASSDQYIRFHTSLLHCNLTVVSDPDSELTKIRWKPPHESDPDQQTQLRMQKTVEYFITHTTTGEYEESTEPVNVTKYKPDIFLLNLQGLDD